MKALSTFLLIIVVLGVGIYFLEPAYKTDTVEHVDDDDADDEVNNVDAKQKLLTGSLTVNLSEATQELAGIYTNEAEQRVVQAEDQAFATVIDIKPLVDLRAEYRNAKARLHIAETKVKNASVVLQRLEKLHAETTNISLRELQQARANWQEDKAMLSAEEIKLDNISAEITQQWSTELSKMALSDESTLFNRLVNQQDRLLLLSLRPDQELDSDTAFVFVNRNDQRENARKAYLISAAPFSDTSLGGETYFLRTNADKFRVGMRLKVWLSTNTESSTGIFIPEEAVVWYAGTPWVYVQQNPETFNRRNLSGAMKTDKGWLTTNVINQGEKVVVKGAQTLLSEEFKWAIPDEDDD